MRFPISYFMATFLQPFLVNGLNERASPIMTLSGDILSIDQILLANLLGLLYD
jgi:hypothetical protein